MESVSSELVNLLLKFLPGFVAAAVFYGLTPHRKASPFERVIEAMIFSVLVQAIIVPVRESLFLAGRVYTIGTWSEDVALVLTVVFSIMAGLFFARFMNNNTINEWLRSWPWYERLRQKRVWRWLPEWQWTSRTSYPSEWFSAFRSEKRYVILHLKGIKENRRLYGWPEEWPDQWDKGQFVIYQPKWLLQDGREAPLYGVVKFLVAARDVEMVEFLKEDWEISADTNEMKRVQELLIGLHGKGEENGKQVSDTAK